MNAIICNLGQTRVHFKVAVARLGELAATRTCNRALMARAKNCTGCERRKGDRETKVLIDLFR